MAPRIQVIAIEGIPEVERGQNIGNLILSCACSQGTPIMVGDILVVAQKIVSKAEGRLFPLDSVVPSARARGVAQFTRKDPRLVEFILRESLRVVRQTVGVLITETRHHFICANSGIDASNVGGKDLVSLLPLDPDRSADAIRRTIREELDGSVAVIISDSFGRPWRNGQTNVAIGLAGMRPFVDYVGCSDPHGYELRVSSLAVVDELASAAELVMGKLSRVPVAIVRGFDYPDGNGKAEELIRPSELDLFR